jgi:hypothetical protein
LENKEQIEQILIPLQSFGSAFRYLKDHYGFNNTFTFLFIDDEQIFITPAKKALATLFNDEDNFITIKQLKSNEKTATLFSNATTYYTRSDLSIKNSANAYINSLGTKIVTKSFLKDQFFVKNEYTLDDIATEADFLGKNKKLNFSDTITRTSVIHNYDSTLNSSLEYLSSKIEGTITLKVDIVDPGADGLLDFWPLQTVDIQPANFENIDVGGKYFTYSVEVKYVKGKTGMFTPNFSLLLCRTAVGF